MRSFDNEEQALAAILEEYNRATAKFTPFNSGHEGFAILKEEVDELWDQVRGQYGADRDRAMQHEAIQVAAMALRFLMDLN